MRKIILILIVSLSSSFISKAQFHYQASGNDEIYRYSTGHNTCRKEILLPTINGYNVYKADLHAHTMFSDGSVFIDYRVREAWFDGLDIIAITDHLELRRYEDLLLQYLNRYTEGKTAKNNIIISTPADKDGIMVDLNIIHKEGEKVADELGITYIKGTEITRDGTKVGHYNALFTTDNNAIYDPDPVKAIQNAKAQGALVMHNHPGWAKSNIDFTESDKAAYSQGLIDGVEIMNKKEFYPGVIDRALKYELFMAAGSDIHSSTAMDYISCGHFRPMTLILAKDKTEDSLKEALKAGRTIACAYNTYCGPKELLQGLFSASISINVIKETKNQATLSLTNNSSLPYYVKIGNGNITHIAPLSTQIITSEKAKRNLNITIVNMYCSKNEHPSVSLEF